MLIGAHGEFISLVALFQDWQLAYISGSCLKVPRKWTNCLLGRRFGFRHLSNPVRTDQGRLWVPVGSGVLAVLCVFFPET